MNNESESAGMVGRRIRMIEMPDDPNPIPAGSEGTCTGADDLGHIFVDWDNGRTLHLIPGVDKYDVLG
jgi:2-keto-3-deoxy-galactonokinase